MLYVSSVSVLFRGNGTFTFSQETLSSQFHNRVRFSHSLICYSSFKRIKLVNKIDDIIEMFPTVKVIANKTEEW